MNSHDPQHLTTDQLDAFLTENRAPEAVSHLATCAACTEMVARDARVVAMLAALPYFDAAPGFAERVLGGVTARAAAVAPAPVFSTPRAAAARKRALGALVLAGGGITAGLIWASANPADALSWSAPALRDTGHALWVSLQTVVANATEQTWFSSVRDAMATPTRALLFVGIAAGAYAVALLGLRRLMTEPATDAGW